MRYVVTLFRYIAFAFFIMVCALLIATDPIYPQEATPFPCTAPTAAGDLPCYAVDPSRAGTFLITSGGSAPVWVDSPKCDEGFELVLAANGRPMCARELREPLKW
jgi:hypothetical protein